MKKNKFSLNLFRSNNLFSLGRFTLIGTTLFLSKLILILSAYFFNEKDYNTFNKAYYTASILILFGSLGFEYALVRLKTKLQVLFYAIVVNTLLTFVILVLISQPDLNIAEYVSVYVYSIFACLGGIYVFRILFEGDYKKYFFLMITNSLLHFAIIPLVNYAGLNIFLCFPFVTLTWFAVIFFSISRKEEKGNDAAELYKVGLSSFIINGSVPFALAADKYIVNHFFILGTANAYTFAWAVTAPLFYIGNLVERIIYSSEDKDSKSVIRKSIFLLLGLILFYVVAAVFLIFFLPGLLPHSLDKLLFRKIFLFMITGYSVYVLFHFPLNGYLFKFLNVEIQKNIARIFFILIVLLVAAFIIFIGLFDISDYRFLLFMVWSYIFSLLIIKWYIIYKRKSSLNG